MFPALLGAFATLGSGFLGANAAQNAADQNYQINLLNYYQREQERQDSINFARQQQRDTKLGSTDASGNRVHFVEGVGWVTDLSPEQRALQELYQKEETAQLSNDLPKRRQILDANVERQGRENNYSSALFDAMQRTQRADPREIENQLNQASTAGITQGFDSALEDAMRAAVRTGASNSGKVASQIGEQRANALRDAFMNNKLNAKGQADEQYDTERANIANLYNMFASRASAMPDAAYNPRNIEGMAAQQQGAAAGASQQAAGGLLNAFAKQGGTMMPVEANYGWANALQSGGSALAAAFDKINSDKMRQNAFGGYGNFSGVDPSMYKSTTGLW